MVDSNLHYLIKCKLIKSFWDKLFTFIKTIFGFHFPISPTDIYFGLRNPLNLSTIDSINFIFLTAKTYIWSEKRWGKPCMLTEFLPYLKEKVLIEDSTKLFKSKPFVKELLEQL